MYHDAGVDGRRKKVLAATAFTMATGAYAQAAHAGARANYGHSVPVRDQVSLAHLA